MSRWGWIPVFLIICSCGGNNSNTPDNQASEACPGVIPARLKIKMSLVLPDFVSPYRVELSSGEVVDQCLNQKAFQTSRNLRDLTVARDSGPGEALWQDFDIRVIHLGDCLRADDDVVRLERTAISVQWNEVRSEKPGCSPQVSYRAEMDL